jgi:hypothetical protein
LVFLLRTWRDSCGQYNSGYKFSGIGSAEPGNGIVCGSARSRAGVCQQLGTQFADTVAVIDTDVTGIDGIGAVSKLSLDTALLDGGNGGSCCIAECGQWIL